MGAATAYKLPHRLIAATLREMTESRTVDVDRPAVEAGLAMLERGGDFADGVILYDAARPRAERLVTFDRTLAERAGSERVELWARADLGWSCGHSTRPGTAIIW